MANSQREINPSEFKLSYGLHPGGYQIDLGEIINTWFPDAHGYDSSMNLVAGSPNPLVGPFLVKAAKPGDTLIVSIHSLTPNRDSGFSCKDIHPNVQNPPLPISARRREYVSWQIDSSRNEVRPLGGYFLNDDFSLPLDQMLGCIGVAQDQTDFFPSGDCGSFGGNMDYPRIKVGSSVYLPVFVDGAYLFLGDGHARQGAGEINGNGIETSFNISFSVQISEMDFHNPAGEDNQFLYTIGNARPLEQALRIATAEMEYWLIHQYSMTRDQVGILMGQLVNYEIGNVVSNAYSCACCFPKFALNLNSQS
jgi:amidase